MGVGGSCLTAPGNLWLVLVKVLDSWAGRWCHFGVTILSSFVEPCVGNSDGSMAVPAVMVHTVIERVNPSRVGKAGMGTVQLVRSQGLK